MSFMVQNADIGIYEEADDEQEAFDTATVLAEDYKGRKFHIFYAGQPYSLVWWENGQFHVKDLYKAIQANTSPTYIMFRNALYVSVADTKRDLFRQYAEETWGDVGKAWAKEILDDERKKDTGDEIWKDFSGYAPQPVKTVNPFKLIKSNTWIFDNMPTSAQWAADLIVKNANERGVRMPKAQTGKYGVEADPTRYKRYMQMSGETAPPSYLVLPSGSMMFGVGRFIAALLRGDDSMRVIPLTESETQRERALKWLEEKTGTKTKVHAGRKRKIPPPPTSFSIYTLALLRAVVEGIERGTYFHSTVALRRTAVEADELGLVKYTDLNEYRFTVEPTELGKWLYNAADLGSYPPRSAIHSWGPGVTDKAWRLYYEKTQ